MINKSWTIGAALLLLGASAASSQDSQCEVQGTNGMVTLLLCPPGLSTEELADAGKAACNERKPCGAWIWTDAADVPEEAPDSHDKLAPAAIQKSSGVWMNELNQMISLEKAN